MAPLPLKWWVEAPHPFGKILRNQKIALMARTSPVAKVAREAGITDEACRRIIRREKFRPLDAGVYSLHEWSPEMQNNETELAYGVQFGGVNG